MNPALTFRIALLENIKMMVVILKHLVNHVPVVNTQVQQITNGPAKHVVTPVQENRLQIQAIQVAQVVQLMNISLI